MQRVLPKINVPRMATVIGIECERQSVELDRVAKLAQEAFRLHQSGDKFSLTSSKICEIARNIEPTNLGGYRKVPAYFANMSFAIPPGNVPRAMQQLLLYIPSVFQIPSASQWAELIDAGEDSEYIFQGRMAVDDWIVQLLEIHPFSDGNGRLAWLLRTWLLDLWAQPEQLPNFFA